MIRPPLPAVPACTPSKPHPVPPSPYPNLSDFACLTPLRPRGPRHCRPIHRMTFRPFSFLPPRRQSPHDSCMGLAWHASFRIGHVRFQIDYRISAISLMVVTCTLIMLWRTSSARKLTLERTGFASLKHRFEGSATPATTLFGDVDSWRFSSTPRSAVLRCTDSDLHFECLLYLLRQLSAPTLG